MSRLQIDIGPGTKESAVEFSSTLDYEGLKSTALRIWQCAARHYSIRLTRRQDVTFQDK